MNVSLNVVNSNSSSDSAPPVAGARFWRSLDELADTAEFREWLAREFPTVFEQFWLNRRQMLKVMAASFALAGLGGCRSEPPEYIVPSVRTQPALTAGKPLWFATAVLRNGFSRGVLAESHTGRPTKLEGNPDHGASLGATDAITQAEILTFYDPDRAKVVYHGKQISTWDEFRGTLQGQLHSAGRSGQGLRLLTGTVTSPTLIRQLQLLLEDMPHARWHVHEPVDEANVLAGMNLAFGRVVDLVCNVRQAKVIVSLDSDFLFDDGGSVRHARDFADGRRLQTRDHQDATMNRLYVAEPWPTVTGASADHRLALPASRLPSLARELCAALGMPGARSTEPTAGDARQLQWIRAAADDLLHHRGASLVLAGRSQPPEVHALICAINQHLSNFGSTLSVVEPVRGSAGEQPLSFEALIEDMAHDRVSTLIMMDTNPVYTAPADSNFAGRLDAVPFTVHLGLYRDETARRCTWHLPMTHVLESWSDARAFDGTVSIIQPLIEPLYEGKSPHHLVAALSGYPEKKDRQILREYWRHVVTENFDHWWQETLRTGVIADSQARPVQVSVDGPAIHRILAQSVVPLQPPDDVGTALELVFKPDPNVWDGRYANNGWLQELPKPLSKLTWSNAVHISPGLARRHGIGQQEVIRLEYGERRLEGPAWITPGQDDNSVVLTLGYGRWSAGSVGDKLGVNAYTLRRTASLWYDRGVQLIKTGKQTTLACTQHHHLMDNRELIRAGTLEQYRADPQSVAHPEARHHSLYLPRNQEGSQWGMTIDLTTCIGCNACVVACQAENNIPVVGLEQVLRGREMHWIRIDSYYQGSPQAPRIYHQPVPCMHCELAPCEVVCPVGATTHSSDGLNEMTYNRCVGTRYCSNNCPYKVRRFNFLDFSGGAALSLRVLHNPEVSVRRRGVMEKCTYCVQRIRGAEITARKQNRGILDGEVVTACQQACPTQAIVFGDINDPGARVTKAKQQPHDYALLGELNTRPRTTYLAAISNYHSQDILDPPA